MFVNDLIMTGVVETTATGTYPLSLRRKLNKQFPSVWHTVTQPRSVLVGDLSYEEDSRFVHCVGRLSRRRHNSLRAGTLLEVPSRAGPIPAETSVNNNQ